jgi:hypothetical protein
VLLHLEGRPKGVKNLLATFPGSDARATLAQLQEKGLVFEEDERYLSLVIEDAREHLPDSIGLQQKASESPGQRLLQVLG